jgi:NADH:ubiquinone oxidoreductase subunit 4 (subunit M)
MRELLPVILVCYPFLGALLTYIVGTGNEKYRDYLADFIAVSEFVLMAVLFIIYGGSASEGAVLSGRYLRIRTEFYD